MSAAAAGSSSAAAAGGADLLSQLAKRKASEKGAAAPRTGRWIHQVGEETMDSSLSVYYCAMCGAHSLILDSLITELPTRSSDGARVVQLAKHECKLLLDEGPCVRIKRTPTLVETQYRYTCKSCALPLAYLSRPFNDKGNRLLYLVADAFSLRDQGMTPEQLSNKEREEKEAGAIVIPVFDVHKPSSSTAAPTTATTAPAAAAETAASSSSSSSATAAATAPAASSSSSTAAAAAPADSSSSSAAAATPAAKKQ